MSERYPSRGAAKPERTVLEAPRFAKSKRRLPDYAEIAVDDEVRKLIADPLAGESKGGALKGVRVVKFKAGNQQILWARTKTSTAVFSDTWRRDEGPRRMNRDPR